MVDPVGGPAFQPFGGHPGQVLRVAVTPDGEEIITASDDGTARVWNRRSGEQRATLTGHTGPVWGVAVTPDGEEIITASTDGTIRVWNRRRALQVRGTHVVATVWRVRSSASRRYGLSGCVATRRASSSGPLGSERR